MDLREKHEKLLYPVVRIFAETPKGTSAGSGTVIYSKEDPDNMGEYQTFVLTNHHVIADLIKLKDSWHSVLKKTVKSEFMSKAKVEVFSYHNDSIMDSSNRYVADVIAYNDSHDLAVLKLESPTPVKHVAPLLPEKKIKELRLFMDICVSGCSMAHEPFCNYGQLTFLTEDIENKKYFMYNAGSYFGNSGGALFLQDTGELVGVPSRLTGQQLGFGVDMVLFMGFAAHTSRLYEFFKEQHLDFLFNPEKTYADALKDREEAEKKSLVELQVEAQKDLQKK